MSSDVKPVCPFCSVPPGEILLRNELCYARGDRYPVNPGHLLIIPFRHVADYFDLTFQEDEAVRGLLKRGRNLLIEKHAPDGFNVGVNIGEAGGQTIWHVHVHLIPRYKGDIDNPRGGVRGIIPGKRIY